MTSRAQRAVKGKTLNFPRPSNFLNLSTRIELCLSKVSTKYSRILKWKAEVRTFLRLIHFWPVDVKSPVFSQGLIKSYSSDFVISFMLVSATCFFVNFRREILDSSFNQLTSISFGSDIMNTNWFANQTLTNFP